MVDRTHLEYQVELPVSVDQAFAWLTDYDSDDPERAGALISKREVREADEDTIVLDGELEFMGSIREGHAEVELDPPDHYTANLFDKKGRLGDIYDYRLEPTEGGSRLTIDYGFATPKLSHKLQVTVARPLIRYKLNKMWEGFVAAMEEELLGQAPEP